MAWAYHFSHCLVIPPPPLQEDAADAEDSEDAELRRALYDAWWNWQIWGYVVGSICVVLIEQIKTRHPCIRSRRRMRRRLGLLGRLLRWGVFLF